MWLCLVSLLIIPAWLHGFSICLVSLPCFLPLLHLPVSSFLLLAQAAAPEAKPGRVALLLWAARAPAPQGQGGGCSRAKGDGNRGLYWRAGAFPSQWLQHLGRWPMASAPVSTWEKEWLLPWPWIAPRLPSLGCLAHPTAKIHGSQVADQGCAALLEHWVLLPR